MAGRRCDEVSTLFAPVFPSGLTTGVGPISLVPVDEALEGGTADDGNEEEPGTFVLASFELVVPVLAIPAALAAVAAPAALFAMSTGGPVVAC